MASSHGGNSSISSHDAEDLGPRSDLYENCDNAATRPSFENAVTILVDAMLSKPNDEVLQQKALVSLKRMAQEPEKRAALGQSGCIQTALTAMRIFSRNIELVCKGLHFIANVSLNCLENQHRVCECRGVELILTFMQMYGDVDRVQSSACLALRNLTQVSRKVQCEAIKAGSVQEIQRVLKNFETNVAVQVQGIATIGNLACYNLETQKRIRDCGCIDGVIEAMKRHSLDLSLLRNAVFTLKHICFQNEKNQRYVAKLGGVDMLTAILRNEQQSIPLIVDVCSTIRYLCFDEEVRACLGQNGCLTLMIETLTKISASGMQEDVDQILKALSNATFSPQDNKRLVATCGGIDVIMNTLRLFKEDADVVCGCLRVFRNIIDKGGAIYQLLSDAHVFSVAMDCACRFLSNEEITEQFFALMLYATAYQFEEDKIEKSLEEVRCFVEKQVQCLPGSVPVQQLGRELSSHLEHLEGIVLSKVDRKSKRKSLLRKLSLLGS